MYTTLRLSVLILGILLLPQAVAAQTSSVALQATASATVSEERTPGNIGLWWLGVKEQVSLMVTTDPLNKAEKQLAYAEARLQLAEKLAQNTEDPKQQERLENMIEKAKAYIEQAEERKADWMEKKDERAEKLRERLADHHLKREEALDRIEDRLPEEKREQFDHKREELRNQSRRLLEATDNEQLPEPVRAHLLDVKARIEAQAALMAEFSLEKKELLEQAQQGDASAKAQLEALREEQRQKAEDLRKAYEGKRDEFQERMREGREARATSTDSNRPAGVEVRAQGRMERDQENRRMQEKKAEQRQREVRVEANARIER